jgi:hypothetical protein
MKSKTEKRTNAIASYEKSIHGWEKAITTHPEPKSEKGVSFITEAKEKIKRLTTLVTNTKAAFNR